MTGSREIDSQVAPVAMGLLSLPATSANLGGNRSAAREQARRLCCSQLSRGAVSTLSEESLPSVAKWYGADTEPSSAGQEGSSGA